MQGKLDKTKTVEWLKIDSVEGEKSSFDDVSNNDSLHEALVYRANLLV